MQACRACGHARLVPIIDLGEQPASNAFKKTADALEVAYPLRAAYCGDCSLMQLDYDVAPTELFGAGYPYFSANSKDWLEHTRRYCEMAVRRFKLNRNSSIVIEIGGNDGHLLSIMKDRVLRAINIEPSFSVAAASSARGVETWLQYFGPQQIQADLIVANNVMAHVPDLNAFVEALFMSLKPGGVVTAEFPHALTLLMGVQFDTIYHEHYSYLSLSALCPLFERHGLRVYNVERLPTHGGSLRLYADRCARRVRPAVREVLEDEAPLRQPEVYELFAARAAWCRDRFCEWIATGRPDVVGYGAAAKGSAFLNYCRITAKELPMVADTTPAKQGLFLPGSRIPIVPESTVFARRPEYLLVLPWNWRDEIVRRVRQALPEQRFVTAVPRLQFDPPMSCSSRRPRRSATPST